MRRFDMNREIYTAQQVLEMHRKLSVATTGANRAEKAIKQYANWEVHEIRIEDLNFMEETVQSPRSQALVQAYRERETEAPPIIVTPSDFGYLPPYKKFEIADGFHRVAVAHQQNRKTIKALVPVGNPV